MSLAISLNHNEHLVYIAFGGNLGEVEASIKAALEILEGALGPLLKVSRLYETIPLTAPGINPDQVPRFRNGAAVFKTTLTPQEVLQTCLTTEKALGRTRDSSNQLASRTIDLDIALYDDKLIDEGGLVIPHPRLHERDFVLVPLLDLDATLVHPRLKVSLKSLLDNLKSNYVL